MEKLTFEQLDNRTLFHASGLNFAANTVDGRMVIEGTVIVWNQLSDDRGGYKVRLLQNSARFAEDTFALYNHNYDNVVGRTSNGTLSIESRPEGVFARVVLPDTQMGRDLYTLVRDRYVTGASFGTIPQKTRTVNENGEKIVEYIDMMVDEITFTPIPAFTSTSVTIGNSTEQHTAVDDAELTQMSLNLERIRLNLI